MKETYGIPIKTRLIKINKNKNNNNKLKRKKKIPRTTRLHNFTTR
jgi:hypothetical protein